MENYKKSIIYAAAIIVNALFFVLCGYGKVQHPDTASYLDTFLGIIAIVVLATGEANLFVQLYFRNKYRRLERRTFDFKFWRQLIVLAAYYIGILVYLAVAYTVYKASYMSVFAIVLCPLWMTGGSRTLWVDHTGEEAYYLDETAKWYRVSNVMENDDVVEIKCQAPADRERTISIAKKNQKLDQ